MEETGCKISCGAPTTLAVKRLMMMMMMMMMILLVEVVVMVLMVPAYAGVAVSGTFSLLAIIMLLGVTSKL